MMCLKLISKVCLSGLIGTLAVGESSVQGPSWVAAARQALKEEAGFKHIVVRFILAQSKQLPGRVHAGTTRNL